MTIRSSYRPCGLETSHGFGKRQVTYHSQNATCCHALEDNCGQQLIVTTRETSQEHGQGLNQGCEEDDRPSAHSNRSRDEGEVSDCNEEGYGRVEGLDGKESIWLLVECVSKPIFLLP
jgi:hypothetical protein